MTIIFPILVFIFLFISIYAFFIGDEKKVQTRLKIYTSFIEDKKRVKSKGTLLTELSVRFKKRSWMQRLEVELQKGDIALKGIEMMMIFFIFIFGGLAIGGLLSGFIGVFMGGLMGYLTPRLFILIRQKKRVNKFNQQINDALVLISNSLKAGYSFFQAMDTVSKEMPAPIGQEFGRVLKEINLGVGIEEALLEMVERVGSQDLDIVIQAVLIQRQVGGNLAEVLDNIAFTIRERVRIRNEIKTLTTQGRMSGFIISLLPIGLGLILSTLNPEYFQLLWTTVPGKFLIALAVMLETMGVLIIRKIINIRI